MADNLRQMVGSLRLHCPDLPYFLGVQFIRDRYRTALNYRNWSSARAETQILTAVAKTAGTVTLTRGSAAVVGTGTAFAVTDVGRQFMANGRGPVFTVATYVSPTAITLDQVWSGSTGIAGSYAVLDAYATLPVDFGQFIAVLDPVRAWQLSFWITQDAINRRDAQRATMGDPWVLADLKRAATGAPVFELWPYTTTQRNYQVRYFKQLPDLANPTDEPMWPITGDTLVRGALADLSLWPGTVERPNPMFGRSEQLNRLYRAEFDQKLGDAEQKDENLMMTWLQSADWMAWPRAPIDAKWMQSHA